MHKAAVVEAPFSHVKIEVVLAVDVRGLRRNHVGGLVPIPSPHCSQQQERRDCKEIARSFQHVHNGRSSSGILKGPLCAVMLIPLSKNGEPLSRQVYLWIRHAIVERALKPGESLPSTRELAEENSI